jgi:hypothetical protein
MQPALPFETGENNGGTSIKQDWRSSASLYRCRFRNVAATPLFPFLAFPLITEFLVKMIASPARLDRNDS